MERRSSSRGRKPATPGTPPTTIPTKATKELASPNYVTVAVESESLPSTSIGTRSNTNKVVRNPPSIKVEKSSPVREPRVRKPSATNASCVPEYSAEDQDQVVPSFNPKHGVATPSTSRQAKEDLLASVEEIVEAPEASGVEVVLNRRGMRQRKRNRYYYDDDMVTNEPSPARRSVIKIKDEPVDETVKRESSLFPHTEVAKGSTVKRSYTKKVYSQHPTPVQVAQAVTRMVRPKLAAITKSSRVPLYKVSTSTRKTSSSEDSPSSSPSKKSVSPVSLPRRLSASASKGRKNPPSAGKSDISQGNRKASSATGKSSTKMRLGHSSQSLKSSTSRDGLVIKPDPDAPTPPLHSYRTSSLSGDIAYPVKMSQTYADDHADRKMRDRRDTRERDYHKHDEILLGISTDSEDDIVHTEHERPTLEKRVAEGMSIRLRNVLKLPKAHKWVCYEWFYSNIDKVLFEGENDFQICFKESFPQLKTRKLTRVEWTKLRRLMGKPRRCSTSFFDEEREELAKRRQKIRNIQQRKVTDFNYKELPDEIPLQLVIGTKVTTRLRRPQDGLFTGTIDGVDTSDNTYRITFDRPGLGTHSIPDYEVLSNETPETVSTSSFALKIPRRSYFTGSQFKLNAVLGDEINKYSSSPFPVDGMLGGFPIRLLDMIVRLSKLLKSKREKILQLKELNVEAEKLKSYNKPYNEDFRLRYARVILDLESMNREMAIYLDGVQQYCLEIAPDHGANQMVVPQQVKDNCDQEAGLIVTTYNMRQNRAAVQGERGLTLITRLASLMLQVKALSSGSRSLFELKSVKDSLKEIKASLDGKNLQIFQDKIEIPFNRIQAGLTYSQGGTSN